VIKARRKKRSKHEGGEKKQNQKLYGARAILKPRNRLCHLALSCALSPSALHIDPLSLPLPGHAHRLMRSCWPASLHLLCKGLAPVGTLLLQSPTSSGDGAGASGSSGAGTMTTKADARAASTAVSTVEPRNDEWRRTATRSQEPSSPPAAGRQQPAILSSERSGSQTATNNQPLAGRGTRCRWAETDGWQWVRREALLHINGESARPGDARECVQWRRCLDLAELS
jgi:hypothetical protein